ncbi:helix-turn-helix domain-containing protein [Streptomyces sp. NPDC059679]|uniref:helix-turn-helix domain-containing protein n=1 Tax=Streptomyces sp. NPDC059679 TaxID=3346903 RepID=UPI0036846398
MALRTNPTERQRRLAAELRRLREQAGLTLNEAGALIGMGRVHLTHIEGGRTAISTERLRRLCESYGCTSSTYIEALVTLSEDKGKGWWSAYKGKLTPSALDLAELESKANELHSYESLFIPGLFQTEDYTASIFHADDEVNTLDHIETAVGFRMQRQTVLTGESPPEIHAVIHEAALHMRFGGQAVMRKQLLRLIELADLPHVSIQVLPFSAGGVSTLSTPFFILTSHGSSLETVLIETPAQSLYLHDGDSVTKYRRQFDRLRSAALPAVDTQVTPVTHDSRDSLGLIQYVLYTL